MHATLFCKTDQNNNKKHNTHTHTHTHTHTLQRPSTKSPAANTKQTASPKLVASHQDEEPRNFSGSENSATSQEVKTHLPRKFEATNINKDYEAHHLDIA